MSTPIGVPGPFRPAPPDEREPPLAQWQRQAPAHRRAREGRRRPRGEPGRVRMTLRQRCHCKRRELEMPNKKTLKQRLRSGESLKTAGGSLEMTKVQLTELLSQSAYDM